MTASTAFSIHHSKSFTHLRLRNLCNWERTREIQEETVFSFIYEKSGTDKASIFCFYLFTTI